MATTSLPLDPPVAPDPLFPALALDSGSPIISIAVTLDGEHYLEETVEMKHSSSRMLFLIDRGLSRSGLTPGDLRSLVGLRGPGSFTGLRVGLATLQGLRQALALPTATLSTFQVLASLGESTEEEILACVDYLRGQWLVQPFTSGFPALPGAEAKLCSDDELLSTSDRTLIGFGVSRLRAKTGGPTGPAMVEPGPLAAQALRLLQTNAPDWNPRLLAEPLYLGPPIASKLQYEQ